MMTKIAYITSGKIGIHRFTYNELIELKKNGIDFLLCLTQLKFGPWMPCSNWDVSVASRRKALISFVRFMLFNFNHCFSLFKEAIDKKILSYFFIALSTYSDIKKDGQIKALHCQMGDKKLYIGYFLKKLLGLPLSVTVHAHELYQRDVYDKPLEIKHLFAYCDKIITISDFNSEIIKSKLVDSENKVFVSKLFPSIDRQKKVLEKKRILVVANWAEKKGYKVLLEAIKKINRDDFVLWVVGGSYLSKNSIDLDKLVKEYGVDEKVALLGRQSGVVLEIIYSACDIFCLPSYTEYYPDGMPAEREGIPVALMEAMAWGKPVISTKHAGIPELVEEILVEEKNVQELKSAICYLLDNPDKWKEMGKRNRAIIAEKYSKDNVRILAEIFRRW
jgi:colanic acid/amylovoran biosynthesis glycosyltransferase